MVNYTIHDAYSAPSAWNSLPQQVRSSDNVSTFRSRTKPTFSSGFVRSVCGIRHLVIITFYFTDCSTISAFLVQSSTGFHHIFLVESNRSLFTRIHLCQYRYLAVFHKDRFWVLFFSCYTLHLSLLSSNVIRSTIIHMQTTPNSRTRLLRIAFLTSLTLCGFASTT